MARCVAGWLARGIGWAGRGFLRPELKKLDLKFIFRNLPYEREVSMGNLRHIILVTMIFAILAGSALSVNRSIYIWDSASPGAEFQHPDSTSTFLIRPRDGWIEALEAIQADEGRIEYAMGDTIVFSYGTSWPADLNPFSVVIISMGWNDGTGPDDIDAAVGGGNGSGNVPSRVNAAVVGPVGNDAAGGDRSGNVTLGLDLADVEAAADGIQSNSQFLILNS